MDYSWYWCRHHCKDFFGPPLSLVGIPRGREGGVIPKNNLHHSHVCTDKFTHSAKPFEYRTVAQRPVLSNITEKGWLLITLQTICFHTLQNFILLPDAKTSWK